MATQSFTASSMILLLILLLILMAIGTVERAFVQWGHDLGNEDATVVHLYLLLQTLILFLLLLLFSEHSCFQRYWLRGGCGLAIPYHFAYGLTWVLVLERMLEVKVLTRVIFVLLCLKTHWNQILAVIRIV